jgi:hypothetical protein
MTFQAAVNRASDQPIADRCETSSRQQHTTCFTPANTSMIEQGFAAGGRSVTEIVRSSQQK